jgi:hypothetical protein
MRKQVLGDPDVVIQDLRLGESSSGIENLVEIGDGDLPSGDIQFLFSGCLFRHSKLPADSPPQ